MADTDRNDAANLHRAVPVLHATMAGNEDKDIDQIAEGCSQPESSEQTAGDSDEQSESDEEIVEEEEEEKEEEDMITALASLMAIDLAKQPQDPVLNAEFQKIMEDGAERLAADFRKYGTPTEGGYWCGKEALDAIGVTCDDVKEQLAKIVEFSKLMRDDVEDEVDEDCEMAD